MWLGVMLGGALGALARYAFNLWVGKLVENSSWSAFPLVTLSINLLGSFLLAFVIELQLTGVVSHFWRVALGVGFLGAFTTFSTLSFELEGLWMQGRWFDGLSYGVGSLVLGVLAISLGRMTAYGLIRLFSF